MFTSRRTSSTTRCRSIRLSPIVEYSRLQPPVGVWTVLNSIDGGHPLRSPKRHSLGEPLPHQLADITQAAPEAINLSSCDISGIAPSFDGICPTSGYVPTCYYLVCHGSKPVRLACLIHTASVHPELGSNSQKRI